MWNFFAPVPDDLFGWRLHVVDLAVNKVLAAAARREPRDFVDLAFIDRHILPLWQAILAAPGKDDSWTPWGLLEMLSARNQFRQEEFDRDVLSIRAIDAGEVSSSVRTSLERARSMLSGAPRAVIGKLGPDDEGRPVESVEAMATARLMSATRSRAWPTGPDIDAAIIGRIAEAYRDGGLIEPF